MYENGTIRYNYTAVTLQQLNQTALKPASQNRIFFGEVYLSCFSTITPIQVTTYCNQYHFSAAGRMARRGDRIRCTIMFENERKEEGKVKVFFTLNDRKIITQDGEDHTLMDFKEPLYPYIGLTYGCSVYAKVRSKQVSK